MNEDENIINIEGISPAKLLMCLYNGTRPVGLGALSDLRREMMYQEAHNIIISMEGPPYRFDYVQGRPLKVMFDDKELKGAWLYDRDAGRGACAAAVAKARQV